MILFVTGQYAGAQYIHPLIKRWNLNSDNKYPEYEIIATGSSVKYWLNNCIIFNEIVEQSTSSVTKYLGTRKPKLIVLSASGAEELEYLFILEAKRLGIKTANFIDTWTNYKNRYIYNKKEVYPDTILSIDKKCTEEMVEDGIPAELIKEIGQPYLEEVCENIPPLGDKILLPIQPIKKTRGDSLGYDEEDFLKLTMAAVKQVGKEKSVCITSHPDSNLNMLDQDLFEVKDGQGIEDIKNAHTIFGMFSMQMIIGYLWGRKVVSVQPQLKVTDPSPLSRWGLVPRVEDIATLIEFMNSPIGSKKVNRKEELIQKLHGSLDRLDDFCKQELIAA
jgi:hypothetical protein